MDRLLNLASTTRITPGTRITAKSVLEVMTHWDPAWALASGAHLTHKQAWRLFRPFLFTPPSIRTAAFHMVFFGTCGGRGLSRSQMKQFTKIVTDYVEFGKWKKQ